MNKIEIIYKSIDEIKPYARNPRNNANAVKYVANSIREFGMKNPIVLDKDDVIINGHTRLLACRELEMTEVPCVYALDLSDEQVRAYRLADNKVAEIAEWDKKLLDFELNGIQEINMEDFAFLDDLKDEIEKPKERAEVEFTEVMNEENNYIMLQFKTDIDWLQAQSIFNIEPRMAYSTRKDGKITSSMRRLGTCRVIDGSEALKAIMGDKI